MTVDGAVVVTGSSSGIGKAVAAAFVERGRNVVLHGRDAGRLDYVRSELGAQDRVATVVGVLSDRQTGRALVETAVSHFGGVDILVNNAGIFEPRPFLDVTPEELDSFLATNLRGTYFVTQAVVRHMVARGGGSIVNIGTVLVDHAVGGFPSSAPIVSKGGLHALTVSLAAELAPNSIRVNMVAPGVVRTPIHGGADVDAYGGLALLNRVGEAREIADAVVHLAEADFTTGVILPVDGGHVAGRA